MAMNIHARQDVSYLFSSLGTNTANAASSNFLLQYASIKNGSYGKLLKAYYNETGRDSVNSTQKDTQKDTQKEVVSSKEKEALTKVQSTTDKLKESADALLNSGKESVFDKKETDAVYNAVNQFVKDYNSVVSAAKEVGNDSVAKKATSMIDATQSNAKLLNQIGITINEDKTLSINKEAFQKADVTKVKNLFNSTGSYGYGMSAKASLINYAADRAASKANTYTVSGTYNNTYNTGSIFDSLF